MLANEYIPTQGGTTLSTREKLIVKRHIRELTDGSTTSLHAHSAGGSTITVKEADCCPSSACIDTLVVTNGKLTICGGTATLDLTGCGGGGATIHTCAFCCPPSCPSNGDLWMPGNSPYTGVRVSCAWNYYVTGFKICQPPAAACWTNVNFCACNTTKNSTYGPLWLGCCGTGGSCARARVLTRALPCAPYTITAMLAMQDLSTSNAQISGFGLRQCSTGELHFIGVHNTETSAPRRRLVVGKYTSATSFSAFYTDDLAPSYPGPYLWLRVADDGCNRISSVSVNGQNWQVVHSVANCDFLVPDQAMLFVDRFNSALPNAIQLLHWNVS